MMRNCWRFSVRMIGLLAILCGQMAGSFAQDAASLLIKAQEGTNESQFKIYKKLAQSYAFNQPDSALWSSLEMVRLAHEMEDYDLLGDAYRQAGIHYSEVGLHDQALNHFYQAISYYDSTENSKIKIADTYHNIGWVFSYLEEYEKSTKYFHASMKIRPINSVEDSISQARSFHALGGFYYIYGNRLDSSVYYLSKAVQWRKELHFIIEVIVQTEMELANAYLFDRNYEEATKIMNRIRSYPNDSISDYMKHYLHFLDGLQLHQQGHYEQALIPFDSVYQWIVASGNEHSEIGINALRQMVATAEAGNIIDRAYEYLSLLRTVERASIYRDRQTATKSLEIVNETKRKEQLIQIQQSRITLQNGIIWISLFGMSAIFILVMVLFYSRKKIQMKNKKIEMLMREMHHRVKNNLQVISSLLGLQSLKLKDAVAKKAVFDGKQRIKAMSLIHQKLYQQDEVSSLDIQEYINSLVNDLADSFGFKEKGQIKIHVPPLNLNADTSLPLGLIINELVTNAMKYAYEDIETPMLELKMIQTDQKSLLLMVKDNGPGFPENFDPLMADSFGLKLVNILIKQLGGSIFCSQKDGLEYQIQFNLV
jgi:two-component system, sensor histidine kinase PdtaS